MSEQDTEVIIEPTAVENEAREFGWVPQEEFKGDPEQWRSAEEFLKRGKEINGFLRKDFEKIKQTLSKRDQEIAEMREAMQEFKEYHAKTAEREYAKAFAELKRQKKEAIEIGDGDLVIEIEDKIDQLKEEKAKAPVKQEPVVIDTNMQRAFDTWRTANSWYDSDEDLRELTDGIGETVARKFPDLKGEAFLNEVTRQVKKLVPERFENPARSNPTVTSSSQDGRVVKGKGKKSYNDLPADAKAACDKFVRQQLLTREQFVSDYFEQEDNQ